MHGVGKIAAALSDFYVVKEIQGTYRGMMIAIEPEHWTVFNSLCVPQLADLLQDLALRVHLTSFLKQPRGVKKKKDPLIVDRKHRHVSTARLLNQEKSST